MTASAPSMAVWWDAAATTAAVLAQLRYVETDVDADRIGDLVDAAGYAINAYIDVSPASPPTPGPPPPPDLQTALEQVTVELYRRKDAPPMSADGLFTGIIRPGGVDPLAEARSLLRPYKRRHGLA